MKHKLLLCLLFVCTLAEAQVFLGGYIDFKLDKKERDVNGAVTDAPKYDLKINPMIGYRFNEKMAVGARVGYEFSQEKPINTQITNTTHGISFNPFFRYRFIELFKRVGIWGEARAELLSLQGKQKAAGNTSDANKAFEYGIHVAPVVSWNLVKGFGIETRINLLSLGCSQRKTKDVNGNPNTKDTDTKIGLNINHNSAISIGVVYKF